MAQKRILENEHPGAGSPEEKRPRPPSFATVIAEVMKMHSLQKFCSALEPVIRRVVSEEVEQALARHVPAKLRSSARQINGPESRNLQLQFKNRLSLPIFTGSRIEGDQCCPIHVVLVDASIGQVVTCGPESSMKVEIVVLEGDFEGDEEEDWTEEEFDNHVVRERDGKRPLLTGDLLVNLKEGVGVLGELTFTDNSSWIRSRKFRLGARISAGCCDGIRIREAKTEAFTVKDHRGELYKKHYPPALHDEVWRLDKIGKDGAFHKRLNNERIFTVQDFLRLVFMDPHRLRNVLGNGMSNKMWEGTVEHAKTCVLDNKLYIYYADAQHTIGVVFSVVYELVGLLADGQYIAVDELSEAQKAFVDKLAKLAYECWDAVIQYDGGPLISNRSHCLTTLPVRSEEPSDSLGPASSDFQMKGLLQDQDGQGAQPDQGLQIMDGRVMNQHHQAVEPINSDWMAYSADNSNIATSNQFAIGAGFIQQTMIPQTVLSSALALAPQQVLTNPFAPPYQSENLISYPERHGFRNEHIVRNGLRNEYADQGVRDRYCEPTPTMMQSDWTRETHEGPLEGYYYNTKPSDEQPSELENRGLDGEDLRVQVQNLIHIFNAGTVGQSQNLFSNTQADEALTFSGFTPTPDVSLFSRRPLHGKAYTGWLKLKAALKWGISVRNEAAARRARLEELED